MIDVAALAERVVPVMIFLASITVVAEIADTAGVFDVAARWCARIARGRTIVLWLLAVTLSVLATTVLSLDTTAVLLTPVVAAIAARGKLHPLPFVLTTVWLANTASLILPVSNLTNLIALRQFSALGGYPEYLSTSWRPGLAAIAATVVGILVLHRSRLRGSYEVDRTSASHDPVLLRWASAVCLALGPIFVTGVTPAYPATIAAGLLLGVLVWRDRSRVSAITVPWRMILAVCALFVAIDFASAHGLNTALSHIAGTGSSPGAIARLAAVGALGANAVNNLPAYLALEPVAGAHPERLMALLIGVNAGSIVTPWGSLATLLWRDRCRRAGVQISITRFMTESTVIAILAVGAAVGALLL